MNKKRVKIGVDSRQRAISVDVGLLIESRMVVQANSGAGKSWALRRLLEQTHGIIQHIIIDVEDEFKTLREHFDYVLAGDEEADCLAHPKTAKLLARKLLEMGVSAIINIYDLKVYERDDFVRKFLDALLNAPRNLWHPALVVVDEAHKFAPQSEKSQTGNAVINLMAQGRKRGFCGILATQRISKLHKDAVAEANNYLIGRAALDVDQKRAADALGFRTKEQRQELRTLKPGEFFAFGPALSETVTKIKIGDVKTTHPKVGQRALPPPPPRAKIQKMLVELAELPEVSAKEEQTIANLKQQVQVLKRELRAKPKQSATIIPKIDYAPIRKATTELEQIRKNLERGTHKAAAILNKCRDDLAASIANLPSVNLDLVPRSIKTRTLPKAKVAHEVHVPIPSNGDLGKGPARILGILASRSPLRVTKPQLGTLSKYKHTGGSFNTYLSRLRGLGYIDSEGSLLYATDEGLDAVGEIAPAPQSQDELTEMWVKAVGGTPGKLLRILVDNYPEAFDKDILADAVDMTASGGSFNTYLSRLRSNGLLESNHDKLLIAGKAALFE